jgi:hypothetical protein
MEAMVIELECEVLALVRVPWNPQRCDHLFDRKEIVAIKIGNEGAVR